MLFYCVYFLALLAPKIETKDELKPESKKLEAIFTDIIKNISRVNNELQELVKNYEQEQKRYRTQDNFEDEYLKEAAGDSFYRNRIKPVHNNDKTSTTCEHQKEMISFEIEQEKSSKAENSKAKTEKPIKKKLKPNKIEELQTAKRKLKLDTTTTKKSTAFYSEEKASSEEAKEITTKVSKATRTPRARLVAMTTSAIEKPSKSIELIKSIEPIKLEISFLDNRKKKKNEAHRTKPRIMSEILDERATSAKKVPSNKNANYGQFKTKKSHKTPSQPVRKGGLPVGDESLAKKEVATRKPKKPAVEKDIDVIPAEEKDVDETPKLRGDSISGTTNKDETLTKDLFNTSVLRQAYGDACLKLVVRKCYKACKKVLRITCRSIKCKQELKDYFDRKSRTGCIAEFDNPQVTNETKSRGIYRTKGVDMTRAGYLSMACQSFTKKEMPITLQKEILRQNTEQNKDNTLNILRDKYEKACRKISRDKCNSACSYAQNATCVKFECAKNINTHFKRNCKRQCNIAYDSSTTSRSNSGSSSGTSYSDSDSGSTHDSNSS